MHTCKHACIYIYINKVSYRYLHTPYAHALKRVRSVVYAKPKPFSNTKNIVNFAQKVRRSLPRQRQAQRCQAMTIQPLEVKTITTPITANLQGMVALFGTCETTIRKLTAEGAIRRAKLGDSDQATAIYFVQDMVDYLTAQIQTPKGTPQS